MNGRGVVVKTLSKLHREPRPEHRAAFLYQIQGGFGFMPCLKSHTPMPTLRGQKWLASFWSLYCQVTIYERDTLYALSILCAMFNARGLWGSWVLINCSYAKSLRASLQDLVVCQGQGSPQVLGGSKVVFIEKAVSLKEAGSQEGDGGQ